MTKVATVMMGVLIALIASMLGLWIWLVATGQAATHAQILEDQRQVTRQLTYISCLLLIQPADRTPQAVATCQVEP